MADNADLLKLTEVRRIDSGEWIASVDLIRWDETKTEGKTVKSWHEKHLTREAALEAVKRLAQEHYLGHKENMSFEARVVSAWIARLGTAHQPASGVESGDNGVNHVTAREALFRLQLGTAYTQFV